MTAARAESWASSVVFPELCPRAIAVVGDILEKQRNAL